ncbi:MAG TPA: hypothetical protein VFV38_38880 [Ktedonobacteraceae bacterium]|nr:hypothetical protein [Ktedonobacteraceae bacterium]
MQAKGQWKTMATSLPYPIHTIAGVAAQIDQGEDPWFALGCFLHDWWCYAVDHRQELIYEPLPAVTTLEGKQWVAFCAATVEELCRRTSFSCPSWLHQQTYQLETPWFLASGSAQQDWLLTTTPEPFQRRNIFVGGNVLDNKYELQHTFSSSKPRWSIWSHGELQQLLEKSDILSKNDF